MRGLCALTGSTGYIGAHVDRVLRQERWAVRRLVRKPSGPEDIHFALAEPFDPAALDGVDALIHCAHDFSAALTGSPCNVKGSIGLFEAARNAGISRLLFVSSITAHAGCRSTYSLGKLEVERTVAAIGGLSVRPGLVWGESGKGMFGTLQRLVQLPILPVFDGGGQPFVMSHVEDVATAVVKLLERPSTEYGALPPIPLAHPHPWPFRQLLIAMGAQNGRRIRTFSIPGWLAWNTLRMAEMLHVPLPVHHDNFLGLLFPPEHVDFTTTAHLGLTFRAFPGGIEEDRDTNKSKVESDLGQDIG